MGAVTPETCRVTLQ